MFDKVEKLKFYSKVSYELEKAPTSEFLQVTVGLREILSKKEQEPLRRLDGVEPVLTGKDVVEGFA